MRGWATGIWLVIVGGFLLQFRRGRKLIYEPSLNALLDREPISSRRALRAKFYAGVGSKPIEAEWQLWVISGHYRLL